MTERAKAVGWKILEIVIVPLITGIAMAGALYGRFQELERKVDKMYGIDIKVQEQARSIEELRRDFYGTHLKPGSLKGVSKI